jgi:hypothetical protein
MSTATLFAQHRMATYKEVYNHFYDHSENSTLKYVRVTFEKKKDKWYVSTYKPSDYITPDTSYLFYAQGKFQKLPTSGSETGEFTHSLKDPINPTDIINYNLHSYFGYPGWYNDVIKDATQFKYTTDSALYSLARAYSSLANSLLSDQFGDAVAKEGFDLKMTNNCLTPGQIKKYDSISQLAISNFKKTALINPAYETFVGSIQLKHANEIVVEFQGLLTYAGDYARTFRLPDNIYPDAVLKPLKQNLQDCPKDAILLSFSDNDYYPVLYLQQHDSIRRDVYLMNTSLLGFDRYIYHYQTPQMNAKGINMGSLDTSFYTFQTNSYVANTDHHSTSFITFDDLMNSLKQKKTMAQITAGSIIIREEHNKPSIRISFEDKPYIFKNEWVLYSIIHHLGNRKLCSALNKDNYLDELNVFFKEHKSLYILE